MNVLYDAAVLIAADRNDRVGAARHLVRLAIGIRPLVTAPVVAQVSRSPRQAQLHRFLRGCEVVALAPDDAHDVGALLAASHTANVVDAHVVLVASRLTAAIVVTSDVDDLQRLAAHAGDVHIAPF